MVRYIHLIKSLHAEKNAFFYKVAEAFVLLLFLVWLLANKIESPAIHTPACLLSYINNHQRAAAQNVVVDKLDGINENLCEIRSNCNWVRPHNNHQKSSPPKPTKSYDGDVLTLWNKFAHLFDAKRKLNDISLSEMYCKVKGEIDNLERGTIGTSMLENFYKCRTNPKPKTLKVIASWIENERREYDEENYKINS